MDFYTKKFTVLMENEPIDIWIKNGEIKKSEFMKKKVSLNLDSATIAMIRDNPSRVVNATRLAESENFKYETSRMLSTQLDLAIAKSDRKVLSRFARSGLVPEDMKLDFIAAINKPRGIRKLLTNAVNKTNSIFQNLAKKIDRYFENVKDKVANVSLDKHLGEYQLKEFNKAPPISQLGDLEKLNPNNRLMDKAQQFLSQNHITSLTDDNIVDKNLQNEFFKTKTDFPILESKQALFKMIEINQSKKAQDKQNIAGRENEFKLNEASKVNSELLSKIESLQKQIESIEKSSTISNNTLDNFEKISLNMSQNEKIDLLIENAEYISLTEDEKFKIEDKYIYEPLEEKLSLKEKTEELTAIATVLQNIPTSKKEVVEERAKDILGEKRDKYINPDNSINVVKLEEATKKAGLVLKSQEIQKKEKPKVEKKSTTQKLRYTQDELDSFKRETTLEMKLADPQPILDDLGIDYKDVGQDSYKMNLRNEKTASAYISLKNGEWKYKDFGNSNSGSIVNVVMDATGKDFKGSLEYTLNKLAIENRLETALSSNKKPTTSQQFKDSISFQKQENKARETSIPLSKVTNVSEVSSNQMAVDYLAGRGITKIPPEMKIINGEYRNKEGNTKKVFGVGVVSYGKDGADMGADIHFLKKLGNVKTQNLGAKNPSFYENIFSDKAVVFESKMDYAAAYQQNQDLHNDNIFIANGVTNAKKIGEIIKETSNISTIDFFNQNDKAGYQFITNVAKTADIIEFNSVKYDVLGEAKQDINDLLLNNEKSIASRLKPQSVETIEKITNTLENFEKSQKEIKKEVKTIEQKKSKSAETEKKESQSSRRSR